MIERMRKIAVVLVTLLVASCGTTEPRPTVPDASDDGCEACLARGGTWQPPECTRDCALQDASCYRDACPGPCEPGTCECQTRDECEAAGCSWQTAGEAMWCRPR